MPGSGGHYNYDVVLSFAGEDRAYREGAKQIVSEWLDLANLAECIPRPEDIPF